MKETIKKELASHILDKIDDGVLTNDNRDEWHHLCFNQDYYIIGYYQAEQWLKEHNINVFEAIAECQEYEERNFGECQRYNNAEKLVNMYVYILGQELLNDCYHIENVKSLKEFICII
jgi:hypothetical protein